VLNGAVLEPAASLPRMTFSRTDGATFTRDDTAGRISLFYFGYTHCPEMCPVTLANFEQIRRGLGNDASSVDMYFVTLDPRRDTLSSMRAYMGNFPGIIGLIGSDDELLSAQAAFHVVAERQDLGGGDYALNHTAATYLVNPSNRIQLAYPYGTSPDDILSDLGQLIREARLS
jgi:protein SCO1